MNDLLQLAAEALADAAKATDAPWTWNGLQLRSPGGYVVLAITGFESAEDTAWIAAARSREPQLAEACIAMAKEVERLRKIEKDRNYALQVQNEQLEAVVADRDELREMKGVNAWADAIRAKAQLAAMTAAYQELKSKTGAE